MSDRKFIPVLRVSVGRCTYCGAPGSGRDHYRAWANHGAPYWIPSCGRCNSWLGSKEFETLGDRTAYIYFRLAKKLKTLAGVEGAFEGVDGHLRELLGSEVARRDVLAEETDWALEVATETRDLRLDTLHENEDGLRELEDLLLYLDSENTQ